MDTTTVATWTVQSMTGGDRQYTVPHHAGAWRYSCPYGVDRFFELLADHCYRKDGNALADMHELLSGWTVQRLTRDDRQYTVQHHAGAWRCSCPYGGPLQTYRPGDRTRRGSPHQGAIETRARWGQDGPGRLSDGSHRSPILEN